MKDMWNLKLGDRVETRDGAVAEILSETQDGEWIRIRYVEVCDEPSLVGTEDLYHEHELTEVL